MSKDRDEGTWDAREAFHRATMEVYADLEKLLRLLGAQPDKRVALVQLGEVVAAKAGPERGDPRVIKAMKRAVHDLRASLATVHAIRSRSQDASSNFWLGSQGHTWGGVASGSYHEVVIGAAEAMLEPAPAHQVGGNPGPASAIQKQVLTEGIDKESWADLAEDLDREFKRAQLLPKPFEVEKPATASPPAQRQGQAPRRLDENVERVFHLLRHYKGFVCAPSHFPRDDSTESATRQLENLLRQDLALVADPRHNFLVQCLDAVGDLPRARTLLASVDLDVEHVRCLDAIARATIPDDASPAEIFAACRTAVAHWRSLQPTIYEHANREPFVMDHDLQEARLVGYHWSCGLDRCPSRIGASLALAVACRALATSNCDSENHREFAPALQLELRLREFPDWSRFPGSQIVRILDEQQDLLRQVEVLVSLGEVRLQGGSSVRGHLHDRISTAAIDTDLEIDAAADSVQLHGWAEILPALGFDPKDRRARERVRKCNTKFSGPIRQYDQRKRMANRGRLIAWWRNIEKRAEVSADERAKLDRAKRKERAYLDNPGVRSEVGIHSWDGPNTRKRKR